MEKISSMYDIFLNNAVSSDIDSTEFRNQYGGQPSSSKPHGGFPPIYLCQAAYNMPKSDNLEGDESVVSIKTLLERRRKA